MTVELQWLSAALALAAAGVVKGATGIGYATFALPLLASIVGLPPAMALIVAPTLAVNASLAISGGHLKENVRTFAPLYAAMIPGVAAGALLLGMVEQRTAITVLGAAIVGHSLFALAKPKFVLSERSASRLKLPVGFLNGLLTGLTGSQVMPLVPYMMALRIEAEMAIQAINIGVLILSALLGLSLASTQAIDTALLLASLIAVPPALAGAAIGTSLQSRIPGPLLRHSLLIVLGLIGMKMILW